MPLSMSFHPCNPASIDFVQMHYLLLRMLLSILRNFQRDLIGKVGNHEYHHIQHKEMKLQMDVNLVVSRN